ncbi:MAG: LptF/LptG family permease [Porphyromonas sp.]|nr:LptF/LptG family permease [Porphyromonas sp.]
MRRLWPKRLYIYIIKTFVPLLTAGFSVSLFVVVIQFLWQSVGTLVGKGVDAIVLLKLLFYASMTMVPLAMILGVLVGSLMTFGNLGERMELLAMKAAGIPLFRILKPTFAFVVALALGLFVFQNDWMITSQVKFWQYYFSIKNKSPELAIPEGSFYKGVDNYSIYVERKDNKAKMMYGMMIYDYTNGFDKAMVVVADSGRLYSTKNGMELILELYHGESFQNIESEGSRYNSSEDRPFVRERFSFKELHIPFNTDLSMVDESILSSQFVGKNMYQLKQYTDSLRLSIDSLSQINLENSLMRNSLLKRLTPEELTKAPDTPKESVATSYRSSTPTAASSTGAATVRSGGGSRAAVSPDISNTVSGELADIKEIREVKERSITKREKADLTENYSIYDKLEQVGASQRSNIYSTVLNKISNTLSDSYFTVEEQREQVDLLRKNESEYWRKFTYPVACIAFFLIGAPLGALIRKGGMGVPFLVAVFLFIIFYILETFGIKMVREGNLINWVGMWLPNMVLIPVGIWLCLMATRDTNRWSIEPGTLARKLFKVRIKRKVEYKEVAMVSADYRLALTDIQKLDRLVERELEKRQLGYISFFMQSDYFRSRKEIHLQLEKIVDNLKNSRDYTLVDHLNGYPYLRYISLTFRTTKKWINSLLMIFVPVGIVCYISYIVRNKKYIGLLKQVQSTNRIIEDEMRTKLGDN